MRVFVAGATGAIGRQLVPRLIAAGHEIHGMTRSESKQAMLDELGAVPVVADALDPDQVREEHGDREDARGQGAEGPADAVDSEDVERIVVAELALQHDRAVADEADARADRGQHRCDAHRWPLPVRARPDAELCRRRSPVRPPLPAARDERLRADTPSASMNSRVSTE